MSALADGYGGYLVLALVGILAHEPWRWLGLLLGRNLREDGEVFIWVRAVATALVAGLVMRLVFFPIGSLTHTPLELRLLGIGVGLAVFFVTRRSLGIGIAAGALTLLAGALYLDLKF
jgi:hypothetical protein